MSMFSPPSNSLGVLKGENWSFSLGTICPRCSLCRCDVLKNLNNYSKANPRLNLTNVPPPFMELLTGHLTPKVLYRGGVHIERDFLDLHKWRWFRKGQKFSTTAELCACARGFFWWYFLTHLFGPSNLKMGFRRANSYKNYKPKKTVLVGTKITILMADPFVLASSFSLGHSYLIS